MVSIYALDGHQLGHSWRNVVRLIERTAERVSTAHGKETIDVNDRTLTGDAFLRELLLCVFGVFSALNPSHAQIVTEMMADGTIDEILGELSPDDAKAVLTGQIIVDQWFEKVEEMTADDENADDEEEQ